MTQEEVQLKKMEMDVNAENRQLKIMACDILIKSGYKKSEHDTKDFIQNAEKIHDWIMKPMPEPLKLVKL